MALFSEVKKVLHDKKEGKYIEKAKKIQMSKNAMIPLFRKQTLDLIESSFNNNTDEISCLILTVDANYAQEFIEVMKDLKDLYDINQIDSSNYAVRQKFIEVD